MKAVLIHSCLFVSAGAAALIAPVHHVLGEFAWQPYLLCFAGVLFIYNLDHLLDARAGAPSDPALARLWRRPFVYALGALVFLFGAGALLLLIHYNPFQKVPLLYLAAGAGVLYGLPVFPWRRNGGWILLRMKETPGLKAVFIAAAVATAVVGLPLAYAEPRDHLLTPDLYQTAGFLFVFALCNALMFDVRDRATDETQGLRTLPVLLGAGRTRILILVLNLITAKALIVAWAVGELAPHPEWLLALGYTLAYTFLLKEETPRVAFALIVDGGLFLPGLLGAVHAGMVGI